MRHALYILVAGVVLFLLRGITSLTDALYFDGKWRDVYMVVLGALASLLLVAAVMLNFWQRECKAREQREPAANMLTPVQLLCGRNLLIQVVFAPLSALCTFYLWQDIQGKWSAEVVPAWYQLSLRIAGAIVAAGASWLVWQSVETAREWKRVRTAI